MTIIVPGKPLPPIIVDSEDAPAVSVSSGTGRAIWGNVYGDIADQADLQSALAAAGGGGGAAAWGGITGTLSAQTDLQSALDLKASTSSLALVATTGAYSSLTGLPTLFNGAYNSLTGIPSTFAPSAHTHPASEISDATTAGRSMLTAADATAQRALLNVANGATANSADATLLARANHTGTQLAATISDFATAVAATAAVTANTAKVTNATHTGEVTGSTALTIAADAVTNAKLANMAANSIKGNNTAGSADPADLTVAQVKTLLAYTAADVGAATTAQANATHTGEVTGATALTIAADVVDNTKLANMAANTVKVRAAASLGDPSDLALAASQLLGRGATGDVAAITLGTNLSMTGTTLNASGSGGSLTVQDEGSTLSTAVTSLNFTGAGVTATGTASVTVNIPGGSGGGDVVGPASSTDNALTRFDLATGKLIQNSTVTLDDAGAFTLPRITTPATPAVNKMNLFVTQLAEKDHLAFMGSDGDLNTIQSNLGKFNLYRFQPSAGSATLVGHGLAVSVTGTATLAAPAVTNLHSMMARVESLVTVAATTAVAGIRGSNSICRVGRDANAPGGFFARVVWGPATGNVATSRGFGGIRTNSSPTDVETSSLFNLIGMGWDAADTNIQFMHNDNSGVATKIDLGANFPAPTVDRSQVYEVQLYSPNSLTQTVYYRVIRYNTTLKTIAAETTGTVTTNLPPVTQLLAPQVHLSVGGTLSVVGVALMGFYILSE